jgi:hypothetical protein
MSGNSKYHNSMQKRTSSRFLLQKMASFCWFHPDRANQYLLIIFRWIFFFIRTTCVRRTSVIFPPKSQSRGTLIICVEWFILFFFRLFVGGCV